MTIDRMIKNRILADKINAEIKLNPIDTMPICGREFIAVMLLIIDDKHEIEKIKAFYNDPNFCDCETGSDLNTLYNGNEYWFDVIGWLESEAE